MTTTRAAAPVRLRVASPVGVLVGAAVLLQVAHPLVGGEALRLLTIASVVVFAAASLGHALVTRGPRYAGVLVAVAFGGGLLVEAVGVRTGVPFGDYAYAGTLGPQVLGVPLVVPLAWLMMAHPCAVAGRRLGGPALGWLPAAWLLASWDVFLDPQMVAAGHWTWADPEPALAGVPGVPVGNYLGWLLVAALMALVLVRAAGPPRPLRLDWPVAVLLLWTYASQVLASAAFFGRPGAAVWGGALMGLAAVPYALAVRRDARRPAPA